MGTLQPANGACTFQLVCNLIVGEQLARQDSIGLGMGKSCLVPECSKSSKLVAGSQPGKDGPTIDHARTKVMGLHSFASAYPAGI